MDAFWGITLSVIAISMFLKRERGKRREEQALRERQRLAIEREAARPIPMTAEKKEAEKSRKAIEKQREKEINELRKQGYTEEIITKAKDMRAVSDDFSEGFHKAMWQAREIFMNLEGESTSKKEII